MTGTDKEMHDLVERIIAAVLDSAYIKRIMAEREDEKGRHKEDDNFDRKKVDKPLPE